MRYILFIYLMTIPIFSFNYGLEKVSREVIDGVYCFFGFPAMVNDENEGNILNTCYVETNESFVVIDSGPTYSYAKQAYNVMQKIKKLPVKYVINTSADEEHILGNSFYKEKGATIVAPKSYIDKYKDKETSILSMKRKISSKAFSNTKLILPDKIITKDEILEVGDTKFKIYKIIKDCDRFLTVYVPSKKIYFAGDMLYNNRLLTLKNHRSLIKWLRAIKSIKATPWKRIISSHGLKVKYSAIRDTNRYLTLLRNKLVVDIKKGMNKKACMRDIKIESFKKYHLYNVLHQRNISNAYDEIKPLVKIKKKKNPQKKQEKKIKKVEKKSHPPKPKLQSIPKPKPKKKVVKVKKVAKVPAIRYYSYSSAMRLAKREKKIVLIEVFSNHCSYCKKLNNMFARNNKIKSLINKNYKMVKINISYNKIPFKIRINSTPTLLFVRPDTRKITVKISGIDSVKELIDIIQEEIAYGKKVGYVK